MTWQRRALCTWDLHASKEGPWTPCASLIIEIAEYVELQQQARDARAKPAVEAVVERVQKV
jgi:hypothetical protein